MASEVDISNLALAHLGASATVSSLEPPEGSAQAEHCARFYPIDRDTLLQMHPWSFATRRKTLSPITNDNLQWAYCYALPADHLKPLIVIHKEIADEHIDNGLHAPQDFVIELNTSGNKVLYTNQEDAALRYIAEETDTTKYSPLFVSALSWFLASSLAGPVIKGDAGRKESKACQESAFFWFNRAKEADCDTQKVTLQHTPSWIRGR